MKKFVIFLVIILALIGLAVFLVPIFVDPNQYKEEIAEKFKDSTGYDLEIGGEIELSLLPNIKVSVMDVSIANGSKTFADVKEISAVMHLVPALSGDYQVDYINLVEPKIRLESNGEAKNWKVAPSKKRAGEPAQVTADTGSKSSNFELSLDDLRIVDGFVSYKDFQEGKSYEIEKINLNASLGSIVGPVDAKGSVVFKGDLVNVVANVESLNKFDVSINAFGADIGYKGSQEAGQLSLKSADINKALDKLADGIAFTNPNIDLKSDVKYANDNLNLSNLDLILGSSQGGGNVSIDLSSESPVIESDLRFKKIVVEDIIPTRSARVVANSSRSNNQAAPSGKSKLKASIALNADEVYFKKAVFKKALINAEIDNEEIFLQPMYAELPGGGAAQVIGIIDENSKGEKSFDGKLEVNAKNMREVLNGLEIDLSKIKPEKLKAFYIDSKLNIDLSSPINIEASNIKGKLDQSSFNGKLEVTLSELKNIQYRGGVSGVDLDSYFVDVKKSNLNAKQAEIEKKDGYLDVSAVKDFPVKLNLVTALGSLKYGGETYSGVSLKADFKPGIFNAESFSFKSKKISANGKVKVDASKAKPRFDVEVSLGNIDLADFSGGDKASAPRLTGGNKKGEAKWSSKAFEFDILRKFDAEIKAKVSKLKDGNLVFDNTTIAGYLKNGVVNIESLTSKSFGGDIAMNGNWKVDNISSFTANYQASDISIYHLAKGAANIEDIKGVVNIAGNIGSSGASQKAMVANLKGLTEIAGRNIRVRGFDLNNFANQLININDPLSLVALLKTVSDRSGETAIEALKGSFYTEKGIVQTNGLSMEAGVAQGVYKGYADLNKWNTDGEAEFKIVTPDKKERPALGIRIYGPIDNPSKEIDSSEVRKYVTGRAANRLIKGNVIPDKYQGVVDSFIGRKAAPSEDGTTPAAPSQEEQIFDLLNNAF